MEPGMEPGNWEWSREWSQGTGNRSCWEPFTCRAQGSFQGLAGFWLLFLGHELTLS